MYKAGLDNVSIMHKAGLDMVDEDDMVELITSSALLTYNRLMELEQDEGVCKGIGKRGRR